MTNYRVSELYNPLLDGDVDVGIDTFSRYGAPQLTGRTAIKGEKTYTEFTFTYKAWFTQKTMTAFIPDCFWDIDSPFIIQEGVVKNES